MTKLKYEEAYEDAPPSMPDPEYETLVQGVPYMTAHACRVAEGIGVDRRKLWLRLAEWDGLLPYPELTPRECRFLCAVMEGDDSPWNRKESK